MNSKEYWKQRALLIENENFRNTMYHIAEMKEQYDTAKENIQKEIDKFYKDFAINNQVKLADAKRMLNNNELKEFKTTLKQYKKMVENDVEGKLKEKIINISIKQRITRLQSLQDKIDIILSQLQNNTNIEINNTFFETLENTYYKNLYGIERNQNIHTDFSLINEKTVDNILTYNWSGVTYSERIWRNQIDLKQKLKDSLNKNFIQGNSISELVAEMSKALESDYKNTVRLIRTEVNYINNKASIESYKEKGIKQYEFVAVLDLRTSEMCSEKDGEIINIDELVVGINCPPLHPNCRSTIIPHIEGIIRNRVARNVKTGETEEIGNMNYKEWYKKYVENNYSKNEIETLRKKFLNYSSDKEQYARYKELLKTYIEPVRFDKFQEMKYNNKEQWEGIKSDYRLKNYYNKAIEKGDLSPLVDFNTYKEINNSIRQNLLGLKTRNGIIVNSYSKHFVDRVCGSVEQKRNGVSIEDIKDTILNSSEFKELEKSIVIKGKNNKVTLNQKTGKLIQTNPYIRKKENK